MWEISKAKYFIEKYEVRLEFLEGWKGSTQKNLHREGIQLSNYM